MKLLIMKSKEGKNVVYSHHAICVPKINYLHCTIVGRILGLNVCLSISYFNF
jgi:hypothetical protein